MDFGGLFSPAAQELGLPFLSPSKAKNANFAQGANFAITGATALDTEFFRKRGLGKTVWNSSERKIVMLTYIIILRVIYLGTEILSCSMTLVTGSFGMSAI
ncbi:hypothetical protein C2845_PM18G06750 [Panicum miliaceum]|uniref:Uncharacterized protein n=1 Tax=Panicum miliaceum TaxID=4540 RepID=A0A3L6PKS0_PANMI|nr:hypothetical protein C2845_PM18G06750 [Panicum miliaceum]